MVARRQSIHHLLRIKENFPMTDIKNTILIVDDDPASLKVLFEYLEEVGFEVLISTHAESVLEGISHFSPDLILLDVKMPGIDGFEMCCRLKASETLKDIPVIFMTALTDVADKVKGFELGAVDYITKPIRLEEVIVRINTHLTIRNLQKRLEEQNEVLEQDITGHKQMEEELRKYRDHLEELVEERTTELKAANEHLEQEITERKQAEEALRESEEKFRELTELLPDIVFETDIQGNYTYTNRRGFESTGYTQKDIENGLNIFQLILPEDHEKAKQNIAKIINGAKSEPHEYTIIRKDGSIFPVLTHSTLIIRNQKPEGLRGIVIDISERKQTEEALHQLEKAIETTRLGITITDTNGKIVYVNPAEATMHGYKVDELIGQDVAMFAPPELRKPLKLEQETDEKRFIRESINIRKDGSTFPVHLISDILKNAEGNSIATVTTCEDITERKQNEEALKKANDDLKARVNELSALNRITRTMTMTPDLQTALGAVIRQIGQLLNAHGAIIALLNAARHELIVVAQYAADSDEPGLVNFVLPHDPGISRVIDTGQSLIIPQAQTNPLLESLHELMRAQQIQSVMIVPLQVRGELIGTVNLSITQADREFTPAEVKLMETIAGQIAGAIENARLFDEEHHQRQVAESLREVALVLSSSLDQKAVLAKILEQLGRVLQYDSAGVFLQEGPDLILSDGVNLAETFIGNRIPLSHKNPTARVFRNKQPLVLVDVNTDPYWKMWQDGERIQSWIGAPLLIGEKAIGVLTVDNFEIGAYSEEDAQILQTFANQAAIAIQNAQLFDEAQHARKEALEAQRVAENANRAKSEFLANMSHEIRTPMNTILGFTELLDDLITDPQQKSYLASIKSGGKSLLRLINDILDLSKIEAGKMDIHPESINLISICQEVTQIFHARIAEKGLDYLIEVASDIPENLLLDEVRLRQVLFNLLGNAIKFTEQGYVKLTARATFTSEDIGCVDLVMTIEDSGIGIPEEHQELIFDAFRQQDGQTTRKYGGTGLGLTITKRLMEMMGGTITLTSAVGKGSIFTIIFQDVPITSTRAVSSQEEPVQQISFEPAIVLIVDDVEHNRLLIKEYFQDTDLTVIEAENGQQALRFAQQYRPHVILMDLRMPIMNGYEATRQLKATKELQGIPVIALTASVMKKEQDKIRESGFDGYLQKPVNRATLFRELVRFLRHSKQEGCLEPSAHAESSEKVTAETRQHLPELIEKLEHECMTLWEIARQSGSFEEIEAFGTQIQTLGERYSLNILQKFGEKLLVQVRSFDVEQISVTLESYPTIIEQIKGFCP
jgi:PAS domain S-box-containing protein